jgi:hypothetical protein
LASNSEATEKKLVASAFFWALLLFCAVNLGMAGFHPLASLNTINLERGEPFNAVASLKKLWQKDKDRPQPAVLFLGSSLMVAPALQYEAEHRGFAFQRFYNRELTGFPACLEQVLKNAASRAYLLAVGGEMASDAYFLARQALGALSASDTKTVVVYGIAPRDFQDNLFPRVDASPVFRLFASPFDLPRFFAEEKALDPQEKIGVFLERLTPLYCLRTDWQNLAVIRGKRLLEKALPCVVFEKYYDSLELKQTRKGLLPGEAVGTPMVYPHLAIDHNDWLKTVKEYQRRYNPPNEAKAGVQYHYFDALMSYLGQKDLSVLVVNMPLSKSNLALMSDGFYQAYLEKIRQICRDNKVEFRDLNKASWQADALYVDSVHLKPDYSKQFMQELASTVASSPMALDLTSNSKTIAQKGSHHL